MNLEKLEKLRKRTRNIFILSIFFAFLITYIIIVYATNTDFIVLIVYIWIIVGVLDYFLLKKYSRSLIETKAEVALQTIYNNFSDIKFDVFNGIDKDEILDTKMLPGAESADSFHSNGLILAKYRDVKIKQAHISFGDHSSEYTAYLFIGKWIIFEFPKYFSSNIMVYLYNKGDYDLFARRLQKKHPDEFSVINKNTEFYNHSLVLSNDKNNANTILNTKVSNVINDIARKTNGEMLLCFKDNKLHIGIKKRYIRTFYNVFHKIRTEDELKTLSEVIISIKKVLDELLANDKAFLNKK